MNASEIAARLRSDIAEGRRTYGSRLPSARDTAETYGVSRQTVAAAYARLEALGLVRVGRGQGGTVVTAGRTADAHLGTFGPPRLGAATPWRTRGAASEEMVQVRQHPAPNHMADWGIPAGSDVVTRVQLRRVDNVPSQYKATVLPYAYAAMTPEDHEGVPPMLAPVGAPPATPPFGVSVAEWLGWGPVSTEASVTVDVMGDAPADLLGLHADAPGLHVLGISRTTSGDVAAVTLTVAPLHHRITLDIVPEDQ